MNTKIKISIILCFFISFTLIDGCKKKEEDKNTPVVITNPVTDITSTTAKLNGDAWCPDSDMERLPYSFSEKGFCYSNTPNPTTSSNKIKIGTSDGEYSYTVGVGAATSYYVKAYAIYEKGTLYGAEVNFTTLPMESITYDYNANSNSTPVFDNEGNMYHTVFIGGKQWMSDNLKVTKYNDGTEIPNITDSIQWKNATSGARCDLYNAPTNSPKLGCYYNWDAVNNSAGICPAGWHVPTEAEWDVLADSVGSYSVMKIKEKGQNHWNLGYPAATNSTGLTILGSGYRDTKGQFQDYKSYGNFWTATQYNTSNAYCRKIYYQDDELTSNNVSKKYGYSVRCVKN